jgi:hypothetical protein
MKKALIFFSLLTLIILVIFLVPAGQDKISYPQPTNGTMVKTDMEEKNLATTREKWIETMHRTAPGANWREIEYKTAMDRQKQGLNAAYSSRNGKVTVAEDALRGEWIERGSNNQAGSVFDIDFDTETNELYLVSSGGSLFKTDFYLQYWEMVNDRFIFSPGLLRILRLADDTKRLVALINREPHFSNDMGLTWQSANAYQADGWGQVKDAFVTRIDDQDVILVLAKTSYWNDFYLYLSVDQGESYTRIHRFNTYDDGNLAMAHIRKTGEIYLIEQTQANLSNIHRYNHSNRDLELLRSNSPHAFGESGRGNLAGVQIGSDTLKLISYNGNNEVYSSLDTGATWNYLSSLPVTPWEIRLFISSQNPDLLLIGAVECYRSLNGGKNWQLINSWAEYYGDVYGKLHADIMQFDEFLDQDGNHFVTISNHGGLSISYDNTLTNDNIGLYDLNVSQYYSVRTSPKDPEFVMAGSQDQGLQRGYLRGKTTANLDQVISGDYGHNVFTKGGDRFWTVYPGGWVSHYSNPQVGYLDGSWELKSENETVWIPPLVAGPDPDRDEVILAGGNLNGGPGSHLIRLSYQFGIQTEQMPFDFRAASGSEISAIGISPVNPEKWYVATNNGRFYYSSDGGQHFTESSSYVSGAHYLYGACILPSTLDEQTVYLSGSGYSTASVVISRDGGISFEAMDNGLPPTMVFGLAANEDESLLFAATEAGPWVYFREKEQWFDLAGTVAPTQTYWSVEYIGETKTVRFGTYGRGIWDFVIEESTVHTLSDIQPEMELIIFPNPAGKQITVEWGKPLQSAGTGKIYDLQGRILMDNPISAGQSAWRVTLQDLAPGTYLIGVETNGLEVRSTFIKI